MNQKRWVWISGFVAALVLGALFGFVVLGDSGSVDGPDATTAAGSSVAIPVLEDSGSADGLDATTTTGPSVTIPAGTHGIGPAPGFGHQVPVAVVEGVIVDAGKDSLTVKVTATPYERPESRADLASVWPSVGSDLTVEIIGIERDVGAAQPGMQVLVLLNERGIEGEWDEWLVQMVGVVDGEDVAIISDLSGRADEQLGYIAAQLGESRYTAFVRIASELRAYKDEGYANGGDLPKNPSPAVAAMLRFDSGATRAAKWDEKWRAADPADRDYDDAPKDVKAGLEEVHIFFEFEPGFIANDKHNSIVVVRDGIASGFAFVASIGSIDEPIPATPGRDIRIVLATIEDISGTVIGTIPSGQWETLDSIVVTIAGPSDRAVATWQASEEPG